MRRGLVLWALGITLATLVGCVGTVSNGDPEVLDEFAATFGAGESSEFRAAGEARVGYEILEVKGPNEIRAWASGSLTQAEFDAIQLPLGWMKNQSRVIQTQSSRFARSPDAMLDAQFDDRVLFGYPWRHVATIRDANLQLDDDGLLRGSTVAKFHELVFDAGTVLTVLFSPAGDPYVLVTRDALRGSDVPTIPAGWDVVTYVAPQTLTFRLPDETTVIRADNEDSFQGPVPSLSVAR